MKKLLLLAIVVLGISAVSFGQDNPTVSDVATASANIVAPITIDKVTNLVFGNIAVKADEGGTVVMSPAGSRTNTDGVSLPATTGDFNAATFTVTGETDYGFEIEITPATLKVKKGTTNEMTISSFTNNSTGVLTSGTQTVGVGGTLTVTAGQATGVYTSTDEFTVTVNYN